MTTLWVLLHVAAQRDYELQSLDFSTAFLQGSLHEEIWLRRPPGFTGSFPAGTQWSLRRPVYGLRQAPREWHDTLRTTLAALGFAPSTADASLFLCTDTTLPPFYILVYITRDKARRTITMTQSHMVQQVLQRFGFTYSLPQATPLSTRHSLSPLPSDESVEPSGPYLELVGCLITSGMGLVLGGRARVVLTGHTAASWVDDLATQRSSQGYTFSLGSGSVSWRSTRSSSILSSSCEAEIYAGAMAAQELRWLTYLLTNLGEAPRSPPVLYVDNKAMLALCQEHRLEHRTKHIALRYFLARELHLLCFALLDWSCDPQFSPTLPMGGIRQTFTLLASLQQNGIAERRIGMYAAHQINLQPRVSLPETTPTLRWTGKVGDASAFRVWGSRAFVRDTTADKPSSRAVPSVFLGFPPDAPGWQFYHPTSRRVLSSQDVRFDELVSYYHPAEPVEVAVDSGAARGVANEGAETGGAETGGAESGGALGVPSWREPLSPQRLREWYSRRCRSAAGAGAAGGAGGVSGATGGAGAAGGGAGAGATGDAAGAVAAGCAAGATGAGGAPGATRGAGAAGGGAGATGGAAGAGAAGGAAGAVGAGVATRATGGAGAAGGGAGAGAAGGATGAGAGAGAAGGAAGTGDPGAEGTGSVSAVSRGAARPRPYYVPLLQQVLGSLPSAGPPPPFLSPPPVQSLSHLQPAPPLPGPSPYSGPTRGLTQRCEPESRPVSPASRSASPVRTVRAGRVSRPRLPLVPGTHFMTLRTSTASQRVPLPSPPASSLPDGPDPESDPLRAASPTVTRFLATAVNDPLFESSAASALLAELVDFAAACRLDYATSRVAAQEEFECFIAASPRLVSMLLAPEGDPDALDIPTPRSYTEAIEGPYSSQWQAAMDAEMASWKSTGTYVDEVPPPGANIVSGMWIFRVKRPPGSPPAFKARYVARGFSQRQGVDFFQTFSPTPKMTTLQVLLDVGAQRDYELHSLDFSTAFLQGSLHEEIWLRRPPGFTWSFPAGTQWSLRRLVYGLCQAPRDPSCGRDTRAQTWDLQCFGFTYSSPQSTPLPTGHSLSAAPSDESVEPSGPYPELVGCLMYLMTCTRPDLAYPLSLLARYVAPGKHRKVDWDVAKRVLRYLCSTSGMGLVLGGRGDVVLTGHADASWVDDLATQRSSQGYTFSLGSGSVSWRSTRSSSVLSSSCEAEIYAGAMAAQELRWLTYLLTDLGEAPHSPPVLYVDNKAMLALCQEHRLEHRTKHIALRYFLAREFQQRGQLRLAYVASQANTADVFTKALQPCDHQPCFAFFDWSCDLLFSPTLPMGVCQTYIYCGLFRL
ncbi:unnamed protein product [Closterium sp. NIES-53]